MKIDKYAIAHDFVVVVNLMLVEGRITGGTAQGLGGILLEDIAYDPEGQGPFDAASDLVRPSSPWDRLTSPLGGLSIDFFS